MKKYKEQIENGYHVHDRMFQGILNINGEKLHFISVYAPDISTERKKEKGLIKNYRKQFMEYKPNIRS